MTLPNTPYAPQTAPQMVFLDQTLAAVSALGIVPCTAAGTNLITLTPNANTPTISTTTNYLQFSFVAVATSSGAVTLQIGALAALPVYAADGTTQLGSGAIVNKSLYVVVFNSAVNSGLGGWIVISASATGVIAGVYNQPNLTIDASGRVTAVTGGVSAFDYLGGMSLSWTSAAPSTTLTVLRGACSDFANVTTITLTSGFSKSTAGAWTAGTGNNGLGTGLTYSSSTWYHVFPIINNGLADVYFDISVTAANQPAGTTAFRRVGSFLTNTASTTGQISITSFNQNGDEFLWTTNIVDVNAQPTSASRTLYTLSVPLGVKVNALFRSNASNTGAGITANFTSPDEIDESTTNNFEISSPSANVSSAGRFNVRTNTLSQIGARASASANSNIIVSTFGWIDTRGRFN